MAIEGGLICMRLFMSMPPRGKTPTTKSYFWRRLPINVRVKETYIYIYI